MLWVYGDYKYFNFFIAGIVFRRQILTYKDSLALKGLNQRNLGYVSCKYDKTGQL